MSGAEHDPVVQRAIDQLRQLPPVDAAAVERVVQAAAAARVTPADVQPSPRRAVRWWAAAGMAAAAAIVGFMARGAWTSRTATGGASPSVASSSTVQTPALRAVSSTGGADLALIPRQFVLENGTARRIAVVGDFNNWNPAATPMTRSGTGGLWSVIVPIAPGRHAYGYMVDDSLFTLDPRQPKARDPDLGTDVSVLMVGRP